jgi:hypothetical protein
MNRIPAPSVNSAIVTLAFIVCAAVLGAQDDRKPIASPEQVTEFDKHLEELTSRMDSMRQQLIDSQNEMDELRRELRSMREQLADKNQSEMAARDAETLRTSVAQLQDETEILQSEVKQHDQIKVETASKYPVRINGALLLTSVFNSSNTDSFNLPVIAVPKLQNSPTGSLSATASQTLLGLDASGPHLWGATSHADLMVDFWGGGSTINYAGGAGGVRLRTAHARLEWPHRALAVAFDRPLISPWQPTSWVSVAEPALSWCGNLWTWSPQLEFRQDGVLSRHLNVDLGLIDPAAPGAYTTGQTGMPSASERSRQPGYEGRLGSSLSWHDHPINFGAGGYYSRQAYNYNHHKDAWVGTGDWSLEFSHAVQFSGEVYRGRAIAGLGGGAFKDYVSNEAEHYFQGLDAAGSWAQVKFTISPSLEANVSTGLDNAFAADLRDSDQAVGLGWYSSLARNQTVLANFVYRPKSYLLLSTEFRQISSRSVAGQVSQDRVLGVATGYIF